MIESKVSLQRLIDSVTNYQLKMLDMSDAHQVREKLHRINDSMKSHMPSIKQLVIALKEHKFEKAKQFFSELRAIDENTTGQLQIIRDSFLDINSKHKLYLSATCAHQCFAQQTFPLVPQFIAQYAPKATDLRQVEWRISKLLLHYLAPERLVTMSQQLNIVQLQTEMYELHLTFSTYWSIEKVSPRTDNTTKHLTLEISRKRVNDELFKLNQELRHLDINHPLLLRYVDVHLRRVYFQLEYVNGSPISIEKVNALLGQVKAIEAGVSPDYRVYLLQIHHPSLKPIVKNFLSTRPQLTLNLTYPSTFQEFLHSEAIKVHMQFPETTIEKSALTQELVKGTKRSFIKHHSQQQQQIRQTAYLLPSETIYEQVADSLYEWIQQINCEKVLLESVKSYTSMGQTYPLVAYQPFFSSLIQDQMMSEEGVRLESLFHESGIYFQLPSVNGFQFTLHYQADRVQTLYLEQRQLFVTERDKKELKQHIFIEGVQLDIKPLMWIMLRDIVRSSSMPTWTTKHESRRMRMVRSFIRQRDRIELQLIFDYDTYTLSCPQIALTQNINHFVQLANSYEVVADALHTAITDIVHEAYRKVVH